MKSRKALAAAAILCSVILSSCGVKQDRVLPGTDHDPSEYSEGTAAEANTGKRTVPEAKTGEETVRQAETAKWKALQAESGEVKSGEPAEGLLKGASPETSALTLYTYDGQTARISYMFDSVKVQGVLDDLNAVNGEEVKGWTAKDASLPVYGIEIGNQDGFSIFAAWTNGYWIAQDNTVYQFDFDFDQLAQQSGWQRAGELPSFTSFPCARLFAQEDNRWNTRFLIPAAPLNPPAGIEMKLESWDQETAVVSISNGSREEWSCGEFFEIQAMIEGKWYEIPTIPGNWGFNCVGFYVPAGETQSMINHLAMYGDLLPGRYRLVLKELSVEHDIR